MRYNSSKDLDFPFFSGDQRKEYHRHDGTFTMEDDEYASMGPASSRSNSRPPNRARNQPPQECVKQFWEQFNTKYPGKVYTVLPDNPYARTRAKRVPNGVIRGHEAVKSYEQAKRECQTSVERIVKECERVNQKYTDPHFDIELDLKSGRRHYLDELDKVNEEMRPRGVKRVTVCFYLEYGLVGIRLMSCRKSSRTHSSLSMDRQRQMYARGMTVTAG